jgi:hypothetical protein
MFKGNFGLVQPLRKSVWVHINGNALYNAGDERFRTFYFEKVRPSVQSESYFSYDNAIFDFLFDEKNVLLSREVVHLLQFSDVIQNFFHTKYSAKSLRKLFPDTFLVHGGENKDVV